MGFLLGVNSSELMMAALRAVRTRILRASVEPCLMINIRQKPRVGVCWHASQISSIFMPEYYREANHRINVHSRFGNVGFSCFIYFHSILLRNRLFLI